MEVFKIEKDLSFDLEFWLEKLAVKSNDILLMKTSSEIPDVVTKNVVEQFAALVQGEEKFEGVKMFIIPSSGIDISLLTDLQLEEMGLMRIPKKKKK
ncbi:MAG: hypothetical protein K0R00_17 [Herbinix sp.]|jgi:hypothetical protein|nr:hypothetical protein [Herbinix sp.]